MYRAVVVARLQYAASAWCRFHHGRRPAAHRRISTSRYACRLPPCKRQRRNATIRPRHFLRSGLLKLIAKNSRTVGGSLPPVGPPVSSHPIDTPLANDPATTQLVEDSDDHAAVSSRSVRRRRPRSAGADRCGIVATDTAQPTCRRSRNCARTLMMNCSAKLSYFLITFFTHCSHHHATTASQNYNLRRRTHSLQLRTHATHLMDCTFFMRMLYKDTY